MEAIISSDVVHNFGQYIYTLVQNVCCILSLVDCMCAISCHMLNVHVFMCYILSHVDCMCAISCHMLTVCGL